MVNRTALQPKNMQKYIIGIDTGGTYTDAVLLDKESGKVIATAKKPTTHYQLALGTGEALAELFANAADAIKAIKETNAEIGTSATLTPNQIEAVAVSSTLATNSVVENKGARVAIIVIGYAW
jgi:N-methylhydantoinase A/oxoprolinase/acetone carboxylase beta subunit